ncbi:MAG: hypothetical protein DRJ40_06055 [Thermoprotei archaeon]|nr:MAG: hypothetical protein DRJ40_06055 [Thermoprotei archaeon]
MTCIRKLIGGSILYGDDLPTGCRLCLRGRKSVIFITGLCNVKCFYCPIDESRFGVDVVAVNDVPVPLGNEDEMLECIARECEVCCSYGVGITGGEPSLVIDRVAKVVTYLRNCFGEDFHVHIYVHARGIDSEVAKHLVTLCDEVRVHSLSCDEIRRALRYLEVVRKAEASRAVLGIEVPVIPGQVQHYVDLVRVARECGASFVNLNELEMTGVGELKLRELGYRIRANSLTAVLGSYETGVRVIEEISRRGLDITVHLCTAEAKDSVQLRTRLYMKSTVTTMPHEEVTDEGTIRKVLISSNPNHIDELIEVITKFIPSNLIVRVNEQTLEVPVFVLKIPQLSKVLKERASYLAIVEEVIRGSERVVVSRLSLGGSQ